MESYTNQIIKTHLRHKDWGTKRIADYTGCSKRHVRRVLEGFRKTNALKDLGRETDINICGDMSEIEGELVSRGINLDEWEITHMRNVTWGKGEEKDGHSIRVSLKRREHASDINMVKIAIEEMAKHAPRYDLKRTETGNGKIMQEIDIFDLHYGKLAWGKETGVDYDKEIAESSAVKAVVDLVGKGRPFNPSSFLFPVGNDFLHIDNLENSTSLGTRQDVDDRATKLFRRGLLLVVTIIDFLSSIAPVHVCTIPGNHDEQSLFHLGVALEAWYRNNDNVSIDNSPKYRKYYQFGTNLIGFVHGDKDSPRPQDLPLIMAQEMGEAWSETTNREWHIGHLHKARQYKYTAGDTHVGVPVITIPSLSGTDLWHFKHGFVGGRRCAESYIWDHDEGKVAVLMSYAE